MLYHCGYHEKEVEKKKRSLRGDEDEEETFKMSQVSQS